MVKKEIKSWLNVAAVCVMATMLVTGCGTANQPDNMSPTGPDVNKVRPNNNTWNNGTNQGTRLPGTDNVPGVNNVGPNNGLNDGTNMGTPGAGAGVNNVNPNNRLNDGAGGRYRNEQTD